ncbi:TITAN-like protein isoform X2 [Benincasa hispida]|uniref:TITAN-like protein isoform X2 n=1 Tax=Benincasa hispida TaxID=102211 RepID=UPI00190213A8|nr:TITAN-like protein isoform X2 [Benincasa hispida]
MRNMKKKEKKSAYEYCFVCKLNHDQGQRHKYFPNHKKSLSAFLSRFEIKLSDVRFFLKTPFPLSPEYSSHNRFWCIFCDVQVNENDSSFACNAIKHLASADHLKNLKHFFWKCGGDVQRLDSYRLLEADVAKWEKKCKVQSISASSSPGPTNDIHNQVQYGNFDNFGNNNIHSVESSSSISVLPLHSYTNEYQVSNSSHSGSSDVSNLVSFPHDTAVSLHAGSCSGAHVWSSKNLTFSEDNKHYHLDSGRTCTANGHSSGQGMYETHQNERTVNEVSHPEGFQTLTRISNIVFGDSGGNVHSGMLPPWLENPEDSGFKVQISPVVGGGVSLNESAKSKKLNPKRVGAAWAEKRKMELEMEKRGEIVQGYGDKNWLPNFGRVWQSGSRKESRKEFEKEKSKLLMVENSPETNVNIQPYISKRMRRDRENEDDTANHTSI